MRLGLVRSRGVVRVVFVARVSLVARVSPQTPAATRVAITISGYAFHPPTVTVAPGTTLAFTNRDATAHTATTSTPGLHRPTSLAATATVVVHAPRTYTYICSRTPRAGPDVVR